MLEHEAIQEVKGPLVLQVPLEIKDYKETMEALDHEELMAALGVSDPREQQDVPELQEGLDLLVLQ